MALEQGRAGEVGLGDEAAGGLERVSYSPRRLAAASAVAHTPSGSRPAGEANQPGAGPS